MKDYTNLTKAEVLALTPEQLNQMTLEELQAVALSLVKLLPIEVIERIWTDRHSA